MAFHIKIADIYFHPEPSHIFYKIGECLIACDKGTKHGNFTDKQIFPLMQKVAENVSKQPQKKSSFPQLQTIKAQDQNAILEVLGDVYSKLAKSPITDKMIAETLEAFFANLPGENLVHDLLIKIFNVFFIQFLSARAAQRIQNLYDLHDILEFLKRHKIKLKFEAVLCKTIIGISYRDDARGGGAFYDHYTLQLITKQPTAMIYNGGNVKLSDIEEPIYSNAFGLLYGIEDNGKKIPSVIHLPESPYTDTQQWGLLFIPGRPREKPNESKSRREVHEQRKKGEQLMIQQAKMIGRPVLAVCAGSWELYQSFGGDIVSVEGHTGLMPSINYNGRVINNVPKHHVRVRRNTILAGALYANMDIPDTVIPVMPVNSVHWDAPSKKVPKYLEITACTINAPHEYSEADTVEAFETKFGVPMVGIQWHPEAFANANMQGPYPKVNQDLINYMQKAGVTFLNRQKVVTQLQKKSEQDRINAKIMKAQQNLPELERKLDQKFYENFSIFAVNKNKPLQVEKTEEEILEPVSLTASFGG